MASFRSGSSLPKKNGSSKGGFSNMTSNRTITTPVPSPHPSLVPRHPPSIPVAATTTTTTTHESVRKLDLGAVFASAAVATTTEDDDDDNETILTPPATITTIATTAAAVMNRPFFDKWTLYFHLSNDRDYSLASYKIIMKDINDPLSLIHLRLHINEPIISKSMLFIMRSKINPMWEDAENIRGGAFSFKIYNNVVHTVWWDFVYLLCGETLMNNPEHMKSVNGLTISPKTNHSIIKVWLKNLNHQDYSILNLKAVRGLDAQIPLFKKHGNDK